jgi:hypothetical protein
VYTRKSEFGGVEKKKMKSVHQGKRVRRCREEKNENCAPGKADLEV